MQPSLSLTYNVRPSRIKNAPLLLLLHGYGSNEDDLFSFAPEMDDRFCVVAARAPYDLPPQGAAWYALNFDAQGGKFSDLVQARQSMETVLTFVKELKAHFDVDASALNLLGFSQGAILSYALSLQQPALFKRVVAMSGYLNEELFDKSSFKQLSTHIPESEHTQYFISHGTMDQVVPYAWAQKAPGILDGLGLQNTFHSYPIGHGVSPQNFADLKAWLEDKVFNKI